MRWSARDVRSLAIGLAYLAPALVIFVVLFLVSTVLFFTSNADLQASRKTNTEMNAKYKSVIKDTELTDPNLSFGSTQ